MGAGECRLGNWRAQRGAVTSRSRGLERDGLWELTTGGWAPRAPGCRGWVLGGGLLPGGCGLQAAVGRGGGCNPLGAAERSALRAPGPSSWGRRRVGSARLRLQAGCVSAGGGLRAPDSFRLRSPAGLGTRSPRRRLGPSEAAARPSWAPAGSRGLREPRHPAAGDWSPPLF